MKIAIKFYSHKLMNNKYQNKYKLKTNKVWQQRFLQSIINFSPYVQTSMNVASCRPLHGRAPLLDQLLAGGHGGQLQPGAPELVPCSLVTRPELQRQGLYPQLANIRRFRGLETAVITHFGLPLVHEHLDGVCGGEGGLQTAGVRLRGCGG